jgi:hypothetical protein
VRAAVGVAAGFPATARPGPVPALEKDSVTATTRRVLDDHHGCGETLYGAMPVNKIRGASADNANHLADNEPVRPDNGGFYFLLRHDACPSL